METSVNNECKAFTSLEQSKKLAEILPLESADMIWVLANPDLPMIKAIAYEDSDKNNKYYEILPAWSLAALLSVLPMITKGKENANPFIAKIPDNEYYVVYATLTKEVDCSGIYDNPVDACVDMIEELKELNLL